MSIKRFFEKKRIFCVSQKYFGPYKVKIGVNENIKDSILTMLEKLDKNCKSNLWTLIEVKREK